MPKTFRRGHYRTNKFGWTYWVEGHSMGYKDAYGQHTTYYAAPLEPRAAHSFTAPNAICPACGAPVFFYLSPFGGRVFFDELGPPWPKHPCTDNRSGTLLAPQPGASFSAPSWRSVGWTPATCVSFVHDPPYLIKVISPAASPQVIGYLTPDDANRLQSMAPTFVHYRHDDSGKIFFSAYWDGTGAVELSGYLAREDAVLAALSEA